MANYKLTNDYWETSGVYDITQGKTQREINAALADSSGAGESAVRPENASGAIATFEGAEGVPLKNLTVNIEPVQTGSGDPSPTNVRPITGWTGANVTRTGKNLLNNNALVSDAGLTLTSGYYTGDAFTNYFSGLKYKENTKYSVRLTWHEVSGTNFRPRISYTDGTSSSTSKGSPTSDTTIIVSSDPEKTVKRIGGYYSSKNTVYIKEFVIVEGDLQESDSVAYQGTTYPITFPSEAGTVYGGTLDVTNGVLAVDWEGVDLSSLTWQTRYTGDVNKSLSSALPHQYFQKYPTMMAEKYAYIGSIPGVSGYIDNPDSKAIGIRSYKTNNATETAVTTAIYVIVDKTDSPSGILCYKFIDPIYYALTPTEVKTLLGTNNIFADCGDVDVEYGAYLTVVENQLGEKIPKVAVAPIEKTTTASKAYSVNELFFMGDKLYIVTADIASGATFTVGTNCDETTLGEQIAALLNA